MYLPVSPDRPPIQPVAPIAKSATAHRDADYPSPSSFVFRGELLETDNDRSYDPRHNLQVSPQNRRAIDAYHQVADEAPRPGRILNGYI